MNKEKIDKINSRGTEVQHFWRENAYKFLDWGKRKHLDKMFETKYKKKKHDLGAMPEKWYEITKQQFMLDKIFGTPGNIHKLIKTVNDELSDKETAILKLFEKSPWKYALFTIKKHISDHLFLVYDYFKNQEYVLWSHVIAEMYHKDLITKRTLYFGSVFDNGVSYQQVTFLDMYTSLVPEDFFSFAQLMYPKTYDKLGMQKTINNDPTAFYFIYYIETCFEDNADTVYYISSFSSEKSHILEQDTIPHPEDGGITFWDLIPENEQDSFSGIFFEEKTKEVSIITESKEQYDVAVSLLNLSDKYREPELIISRNMTIVLYDLWDIEIPAVVFKEGMRLQVREEQLQREEEEANIKWLNRYASTAELAFLGREMSKKDEVRQLDHFITLKNMEDMDNFPYVCQFEGFHRPGMEWLRPFYADAKEGILYTFQRDDKLPAFLEKACENLMDMDLENIPENINLQKNTVTFEKVMEFVNYALGRFYRNCWPFVLGYFFYLLYRFGSEFRPPEKYIFEVMRVSWFFLFPFYNEKVDDELFSLAAIMVAALSAAGFVDTTKTPEGKIAHIKGSECFFDWIQWKDGVMK